LELVLSLPILLFVMALMINLGNVGAWKVRTHAAARQAAWRAFTPRTGANDPHPRGWPRQAQMTVDASTPAVFPDDPFAGFDVVRGPQLADAGGMAVLPVNDELLDNTNGLREGVARYTKDYPLMQRGMEQFPRYRRADLDRAHVVLDGTRWQFRTMGYGSNLSRRIPLLYPIDLQSLVPDLADAFSAAAAAVHFNPQNPQLTPLEGGDPEVYQLTGGQSPDFQPRIPLGNVDATIPALRGRDLFPTYCEANPQAIRDSQIVGRGRLLDRIRHVPHRMTDYYIGVYQSVIDRLEASMPPPPGAAALIAELRAKIDQLRRFRATLPP
jgi:hypothetical protein